MIKINPYLNFDGNTEEAFNFYKSVLGGEFSMLQRFKETPEAGNIPEADADKLMHVSLPIGNNILMGTDSLDSMGHKLVVGNNISLSLEVDSQEEADKLFAGLAIGGKVDMPMAMAFWGQYFGMLIDKYGVHWMVSFSPKK